MTVKTNETRMFMGKELQLVDINQYEQCTIGESFLFEVVDGDFWRRFRKGFLIARTEGTTEKFTAIIKAYQREYPNAKLYLSGAKK